MDPATSGSQPAQDADRLVVETLVRAVEALDEVLGPDTEVVLHDLSLLPNSLVAISGHVTGRSVGDPITDFLLAKLTDPASPDHQSYPTRLADQRELISHTTLFRGVDGRPIAALCSNVDTSRWGQLEELVGQLSPTRRRPQHFDESLRENFPHDIDELRQHLLDEAIGGLQVPVELMHKRHKMEVVATLRRQGYFELRDAVPSAAAALQVSRFTVYNYLRQLERPDDGDAPASQADGSAQGGVDGQPTA